jgi:hypothetical protein
MSMDREIIDNFRDILEQGYRKLKPEYASMTEQDIIEGIKEMMWREFDSYMEEITEEGNYGVED